MLPAPAGGSSSGKRFRVTTMLPRLRTLVLPLLVPGALLVPGTFAQRQFGGTPSEAPAGLVVPTLELTPPDVPALLREDAARGDDGAWRFGVVQPVAAGLRSAGVWQRLPNGDRIWRLRVRSAGARSLGIVFERFALPPGAELFVQSDDGEVVRGAYLEENNRASGSFAVQPTPGEALRLEYYLPADAPWLGELELDSVIHDYRGILEPAISAALGGSCNVDVACPSGIPWRNQADATMQIVANGLACSGVLLNNTAQDSRPIVLTARHCGRLENAVFVFNYENSTCRGNDAPNNRSVSGAVQLAVDRDLDFRLVQIDELVPPEFDPYYAGWSRSSTPATSSVCTHHPSGCPKKISTDLDPPVKNTGFWQVVDWDEGTTEPGSSGSPLFDQDGRVRGQLSSGLAACGNNESDFFGALDEYWDLVAPFLDPLGTGVVALDGFDPDLVGPARIDAVVPAVVDVLIPGIEETITIQGGNFSSSSVPSIDGLPLQTSWTLVDPSTITFDMPNLATLGTHTVEVANPMGTATFPIQVVPPATPKLENFDGTPGAPIFEFFGAILTFGGQPGAVHCLLGSFSPLPSVMTGFVALDLGNQFTDLYHCGQFVIGTEGTTQALLPVAGLGLLGRTIYFQTVDVKFPLPLDVSNLQSGVVQ